MVPYSAEDQAPGFDAYLLTVANELLGAADPTIKERGVEILRCMRDAVSAPHGMQAAA